MSIVEKALRKTQTASSALLVSERPPAKSERAEGTGASQRPIVAAQINRQQLREAGLLPVEADERSLAEQYRAIKRPILRNSREPASAGALTGRLIMVASALPGEGKTFSCINLALSLALEKDFTIVLVDADLAKPHITRLFGLHEKPGLLDILSDPDLSLEAGLHAVTYATDVPGLSLIPAGRHTELAAELLSSARMRQVAEHLARIHSHGIVLFDSSPILLTTEARTLSSLVGQIVLVVKAGATPQQAVKDAVNLIGGGGKIGLVLNQAVLSGAAGYYYGYTYGYKASVKP